MGASWEQQLLELLKSVINSETGSLNMKSEAINDVYDSSTVIANRDGNVLERLEYIIQLIEAL